jgi:hypothetical protein
MQTAFTGGTDVHAGTFSDRLQTLKDLDLLCIIFLWSVYFLCH